LIGPQSIDALFEDARDEIWRASEQLLKTTGLKDGHAVARSVQMKAHFYNLSQELEIRCERQTGESPLSLLNLV
jgi:hypothetical protein